MTCCATFVVLGKLHDGSLFGLAEICLKKLLAAEDEADLIL